MCSKFRPSHFLMKMGQNVNTWEDQKTYGHISHLMLLKIRPFVNQRSNCSKNTAKVGFTFYITLQAKIISKIIIFKSPNKLAR